MSYSDLFTPHIEPKSYVEACKYDCRNKAMQVELSALMKTNTWNIVYLPANTNPICCRWVYKIKHHADGIIERFKARIVSKGYNQIKGLYYFKTYSHVTKLTTVRTVIAIVSINNWHLHLLDVNNAFLHGQLQEDVYMTIPPGVTTFKSNKFANLLILIWTKTN
ncbi:uncharacterized mitochondrial protein AtMg00820-like [Vicia villosa]|uniref:uncharacterized mitochondrial protein AtMg00820-like n=1 Tax=Vicia villosa TaxID=3911 RepID=UPI00273A7889|nr:uncharacterized mitochondrial protein AtMg00820-like [Vicia villosa]